MSPWRSANWSQRSGDTARGLPVPRPGWFRKLSGSVSDPDFQETRDASKVAGLFAKHFQALDDSLAERRRKIVIADYIPQYSTGFTTTTINTHRGARTLNNIDFEERRKLDPLETNRFNVPLGVIEIERSTSATRLLPEEVPQVLLEEIVPSLTTTNACLGSNSRATEARWRHSWLLSLPWRPQISQAKLSESSIFLRYQGMIFNECSQS